MRGKFTRLSLSSVGAPYSFGFLLTRLTFTWEKKDEEGRQGWASRRRDLRVGLHGAILRWQKRSRPRDPEPSSLFRFSDLLALLLIRPTFPRWLVAVPGARRLCRFEGLCVRYRPIVNLVTRRFSNCDLRMNSLAMRCRFRTCRCTLGFHSISVWILRTLKSITGRIHAFLKSYRKGYL